MKNNQIEIFKILSSRLTSVILNIFIVTYLISLLSLNEFGELTRILFTTFSISTIFSIGFQNIFLSNLTNNASINQNSIRYIAYLGIFASILAGVITYILLVSYFKFTIKISLIYGIVSCAAVILDFYFAFKVSLKKAFIANLETAVLKNFFILIFLIFRSTNDINSIAESYICAYILCLLALVILELLQNDLKLFFSKTNDLNFLKNNYRDISWFYISGLSTWQSNNIILAVLTLSGTNEMLAIAKICETAVLIVATPLASIINFYQPKLAVEIKKSISSINLKKLYKSAQINSFIICVICSLFGYLLFPFIIQIEPELANYRYDLILIILLIGNLISSFIGPSGVILNLLSKQDVVVAVQFFSVIAILAIYFSINHSNDYYLALIGVTMALSVFLWKGLCLLYIKRKLNLL